jgi:hypothetical protein
MDDFKQSIKKFIEFDNQIKDMQQQIKKLKGEKDNLDDAIVSFMTQNKIEICNCENNVVVLKEISQTESINKEYINNTLKRYFETNEIPRDVQKFADNTTDFLLKNREVTNKQKIKIQKKK